ncbi:MAG: hypothetical protein J0M15_06920 [Deltaproteobacteria bacterium]|jgi:hypothetical protein|nr:hypothetical protein [Deltaproteobacteria bacterium]
MTKMITTFLFSFLMISANTAHSKEKLFLLGDSWAFLMCFHHSFDKSFEKFKIEAETAPCYFSSKPGMRAKKWLGSNTQKYADKLLNKNTESNIIYLSIGGNDFLNYWNKHLTIQEENLIFEEIKSDIEKILVHMLKIKPHAKILLSGYDYARFTENHPIKAYRKAYEQMGQPSPGEIHRAIIRFSEKISEVANFKNIFYIQHYGLMNFYDGIPEAHISPLKTLSPEFISSPHDPLRTGGDPNFHLASKSMLHLFSLTDAFHLSGKGFDKIAEHSTFHYLKTWFK